MTLAVTLGCAGTWMPRSPNASFHHFFNSNYRGASARVLDTHTISLPLLPLPYSILLGVSVTPKGDEVLPFPFAPCHTHTYVAVWLQNKLYPLPAGYQQGHFAAARPSDEAKQNISLCFYRHSNTQRVGETPTPPS